MNNEKPVYKKFIIGKAKFTNGMMIDTETGQVTVYEKGKTKMIANLNLIEIKEKEFKTGSKGHGLKWIDTDTGKTIFDNIVDSEKMLWKKKQLEKATATKYPPSQNSECQAIIEKEESTNYYKIKKYLPKNEADKKEPF